jgi:hypothetical protein
MEFWIDKDMENAIGDLVRRAGKAAERQPV